MATIGDFIAAGDKLHVPNAIIFSVLMIRSEEFVSSMFHEIHVE